MRDSDAMGGATWPLLPSAVVFIAAAAGIAWLGVRLTAVTDRLAAATGLGQAVMGAVFLGGSTSLSGIVTSVTAAAAGHAELAVSNALGGIAAQTVFLAIADMTYRKANLEHAAASAANLMQGALLVCLLAMPLLAMNIPEFVLWGVHPVSPLLMVAYWFGMRLVSESYQVPMWQPRFTRETRRESKQKGSARLQWRQPLWVRLLMLAVGVAVCGWLLARSAVSLSVHLGWSETLVGVALTAVCTSFPELVTAVAAVRRGALTLAVGDVIGGNAFDTLVLALSDGAYRGGSIYHAISGYQTFLLALSILLTAILLMGLLRREKRGIAGIGMESFLVLVFYGLALAALIITEVQGMR